MKLLRTIRFDGSDDHVFEHAAPAEEMSVSGGFEFAFLEPGDLTGKTRQAFANGFLGVPSFGRSTFAVVSELSEDERGELLLHLCKRLVEVHGAPSLEAARAVVEEEIEFVREMCAGKPVNTVFTIRRVFDEDAGIKEEFREITPPTGEPLHARIWDVVNDDA